MENIDLLTMQEMEQKMSGKKKSPQMVYIVKQKFIDNEYYIDRGFHDRMDAELYVDCKVQLLYILSKDNPNEFEIETGYSPEYFDNMESILTFLRTNFHIEYVIVY